jgi:hypothetical protein
MAEPRMIFQLCVVVSDVRRANANWARILGVPEATIVTIFPDGILHYTHDNTDVIEKLLNGITLPLDELR